MLGAKQENRQQGSTIVAYLGGAIDGLAKIDEKIPAKSLRLLLMINHGKSLQCNALLQGLAMQMTPYLK